MKTKALHTPGQCRGAVCGDPDCVDVEHGCPECFFVKAPRAACDACLDAAVAKARGKNEA